MNSLGIYEIELQIKGKTFEHHINLINQLSHNIIEIDFMHKQKLNYNVQTQQVKISVIDADQSIALWMSWRHFIVGDVEKLEQLHQQFVNELLAGLHVNLCRNAKFQKPFLASATISASLLAMTTAYLVNASVMQSTNFLLLSTVIMGPNR